MKPVTVVIVISCTRNLTQQSKLSVPHTSDEAHNCLLLQGNNECTNLKSNYKVVILNAHHSTKRSTITTDVKCLCLSMHGTSDIWKWIFT